jgi:DNA-binding response OmpR family regulator
MCNKILIIDDDLGIVESTQYLLEYAGYSVRPYLDSTIGLKEIGHSGYMPDLILLDYWLPKENGGAITKMLKSRNDTKGIPIIIISASYSVQELTKEAGADDFIAKPFDMDVLLSKVKKYIKKKRETVS